MLGGGSVSSVKPANNAFTGWGNRGFGKNGLKIIQEEGQVPTGVDEPGFRDVLVGFAVPQEPPGTFSSAVQH